MNNKFFASSVVVLGILASHGCATTGLGGLSVPGYEVNRVVAANQAMVWTLANSMYGPPGLNWPQVGYFMTPVGHQVVCRPKPREHQFKDVVGATLVGLGIGGISAGWRGAGYGSAAGAGGGLLYSNHEYDCYVVQPTPPVQPAPPAQPAPPMPPAPPAAPPVPPMPVLEPVPQRLAGVEFIVVNETSSVLIVESVGRRAVLKQRAQARVSGTDVSVFLVQPDGKGSFDEFEIDLRGTEDASLPGWRITDRVRLKSP